MSAENVPTPGHGKEAKIDTDQRRRIPTDIVNLRLMTDDTGAARRARENTAEAGSGNVTFVLLLLCTRLPRVYRDSVCK